MFNTGLLAAWILAGRCWRSRRMTGGGSRLRSRRASSTWPEAHASRLNWAQSAQTLSHVPHDAPAPISRQTGPLTVKDALTPFRSQRVGPRGRGELGLREAWGPGLAGVRGTGTAES